MSARVEARELGKRFQRRSDGGARAWRSLLRSTSRKGEAFWALDGVSFEVAPGEMLGVIGRNGSGKSTLLRLLGGVMRPDAGELAVSGRVSGLLELNTGMHPDLSGRDNIFINGVVAGLTRREVAERFDDIVAFAELEDFIDAPVRTYSSGMKLRLGFAVAVHTRPEVMLIDEVLSVGDLAFQRKCLDRIRRFKADGCAIVLISHDLAQVEALCERALWLRGGRVAASGPAAAVVGDYKAEMTSETRRRTPVDARPERTRAGATLTPHENRFGSLEVRILDVRLVDGHGRAADTLDQGDPLRVEVDLLSEAALPAPHLSVSIGSSEREDLLDLNTDADRAALPAGPGAVTVTLSLERLDLAAGDYFVNVGIYEGNWAYAYDYHWRVYPLSVRAGAPGAGVLAPPRRWEVLKARGHAPG